jgi:hypothetical protein
MLVNGKFPGDRDCNPRSREILSGISPRMINTAMKNPLKGMLSEGPIIKTLASVASSVVGGTGFEPATSTV